MEGHRGFVKGNGKFVVGGNCETRFDQAFVVRRPSRTVNVRPNVFFEKGTHFGGVLATCVAIHSLPKRCLYLRSVVLDACAVKVFNYLRGRLINTHDDDGAVTVHVDKHIVGVAFVVPDCRGAVKIVDKHIGTYKSTQLMHQLWPYFGVVEHGGNGRVFERFASAVVHQYGPTLLSTALQRVAGTRHREAHSSKFFDYLGEFGLFHYPHLRHRDPECGVQMAAKVLGSALD
mmetsp:Transcript_31605/g.82804  ORF Transcript_31605/g.82804 Transcript_31605/m.82804 type:complete len:231 (-) Transcript_31605:469-1161(-)